MALLDVKNLDISFWGLRAVDKFEIKKPSLNDIFISTRGNGHK